jgi:hypothetical protein
MTHDADDAENQNFVYARARSTLGKLRHLRHASSIKINPHCVGCVATHSDALRITDVAARDQQQGANPMTDLTADAVDLLRAAHQGDEIGYARLTQQLRRNQCGGAMTRELAELFIDVLRVMHKDDDAAVLAWLDDFAKERLRLTHEDLRHV